MTSMTLSQDTSLRKPAKIERSRPANDFQGRRHLDGDALKDWDHHTRHYLRHARD